MIGEAAAVIATVKSSLELAQRLMNNDSREELKKGVTSLTNMLHETGMHAMNLSEEKVQLVEEVLSLKRRLADLEREMQQRSNFDENSGKYERIRMPTGILVYKERAPIEGAPEAYFCPHCFSEKKARVLQPRTKSLHRCHSCNFSEHLFQQPKEVPPRGEKEF